MLSTPLEEASLHSYFNNPLDTYAFVSRLKPREKAISRQREKARERSTKHSKTLEI